MATEIKNSTVKPKSSAPDGSSKGKKDSSAVKKRVESASTKSEVKSKSTSSSSETTTKTTIKVRQKKVYTLHGQKHDPPEQKEPLRVFYESLSKQIPTSEMAEFWLMEHGMLSPESAKRAFEKKQRKQKELRAAAPVKPSKPETKTETSQKQQQASKNGDIKAKKKIVESDDDDDEEEDNDNDDNEFILSHKRRKG
ncbi:hypothetical protein LR48_Vigan01g018900 [Vigna angularis]|uniref:Uncharacterized protein n=2 Tax=Phaseolus angularis TaxID=3914 RepID=A0A0L9TJ98_PHAAN|nr:uncharacterized protein LOC108341349 [Vigna angularis]KOM30635.1 hypothetical protein LR48_Vigan01g018900 [Vigna angularis]